MDLEWTSIVSSIAAILITELTRRWVVRYFRRYRLRKDIAQKGHERVAQKNALRAKLKGHQQVWEEVVSLEFKTLIDRLKSGQISATTALKAFQWSAIQADDELNCVTEFIEEAETWANTLDSLPHDRRGPFHGLPFSVKANFKVKGHAANVGLVQFLKESRSEQDAVAVTLIKELGGIPFCLTNTPALCLSMQCSNQIYGQTGNPCNASKEPGGSSGGEAALIGKGGSLVGMGNDLGGSLRCPAAFCGIASLKPTFGRHLSSKGLFSPLNPNLSLNFVSGFMSKSVEGLVYCYKNLLENMNTASKLDQENVPINWDSTVFEAKRRLRIGYSTEDTLFPIHPGLRRAVLEAKKILETQGHIVVEFPLPNPTRVNQMYSGFVYADNLKGLHKVFESEVGLIDPSLQGVKFYASLLNNLPKFTHPIVRKIMTWIDSRFLYQAPYNSVPLMMRKKRECNEFSHEYLDEMNKAGIDAILCPGSITPAPDKGFIGDFPREVNAAYTAWNLFNFPAGVLPVTKVTQEDQDKMVEKFSASGKYGQLLLEGCKDSLGLPLAVQVVGRRFQEELVLRVMQDIQTKSSMNQGL